MGILDIFKKQEKQEIDKTKQIEELPYHIDYSTTSDGRLQIDLFDSKANFKKFYDTTRLIINTTPTKISDRDVYDCMVSWYSQDDAIMVDRNGKEVGRKNNYIGVLTQVNLNLLKTDPQYSWAVMNGLLDRDRVERYIRNGLEENPEVPCGKYVGGIMKKDDKYTKFFDTQVGEASHNSEIMKNRRENHRIKEQKMKEKEILKKQEQINRLKNEIDQLYK